MGFKINKVDANLNTIAVELNVKNLAYRRRNADICRIFNLLNNSIDCPEILCSLDP